MNTTFLIGTKNNDQPIIELAYPITVFVYTDSKVCTCPFQYRIGVGFLYMPDVPRIEVYSHRIVLAETFV